MSSGKKILIIFISLLVLAAVGATVWLVLQQQEIRGRAAPATTLSFDPGNVIKAVGDTFTLNINIDTGSNSVTGAELHVQYDSTKLNAVSIAIAQNSFLPIILQDGAVGGGFAFLTVGSQPTEPKKGTGTIATITFRAVATTEGSPTLVRFTGDTRVAGVGEGSTNVLSGVPAPASIVINTVVVTPTAGLPTSTPIPTVRVSPTTTIIPSLTPGIGGGNVGIGSTAPTATPTKFLTPTALPTVGGLPVTGDVSPTLFVTLGGVGLFLIGAFALLVL